MTLLVSSYIRLTGVVHSINSGNIPPDNTINEGYIRHPVLTFFHILPGCLFLLSGAWQFIRPMRNRLIHIHRWNGRIYLISGLIIGITGIIMGLFLHFGGFAETLAATGFGIYFLYALLRAYKHIRKKEYGFHREWMIRAYSIGLAVATIRPLTWLFFTFSEIPFNNFFGIAFWIAFILHTIIAEIWVKYTRTLNR